MDGTAQQPPATCTQQNDVIHPLLPPVHFFTVDGDALIKWHPQRHYIVDLYFHVMYLLPMYLVIQ